jgi:hypothetical protein
MKKKYEPPLITNPELGKPGFIPLGATGCNVGDIGSACASGNEPQGGKCGVGNQPETLNCLTGTSAGNSCLNGSDAVDACDVGLRVAGDCMRGDTPLGAICGSGNSASTCNSGSGGAA